MGAVAKTVSGFLSAFVILQFPPFPNAILDEFSHLLVSFQSTHSDHEVFAIVISATHYTHLHRQLDDGLVRLFVLPAHIHFLKSANLSLISNVQRILFLQSKLDKGFEWIRYLT